MASLFEKEEIKLKLLNRFFILIIILASCLSGCTTNKSNIKWETIKVTTDQLNQKKVIIDSNVQGEIIPEEAKFKARALTNKHINFKGKKITLTEYGDIVDVLDKRVGVAKWLWMIRTKDGHVYGGTPSDYEVIEDLRKNIKEESAKNHEGKRDKKSIGSSGLDKVVDNYLHGETYSKNPILKAKALIYRDKIIGPKNVILTKYGDIVEVLSTSIRNNSSMWVIRTKDRYVYIEFPSNLKVLGPVKNSVVEISEAISKDKILDKNLLDETISNKPLFNAFALGVSGRFVNGEISYLHKL